MLVSLDRLARPFVVLSERYYPDPFVFAIVLSGATFALAVFATPASPLEAVSIWGGGLTAFLGFAMQVCLVLVFAHALAHTRTFHRAIEIVATFARTPAQAYALVAVVSGFASFVAWGLGMVVGALAARAVAEAGRARRLALHFPLLVASAYSGFVVWHMGYSGTALLAVATPGHTLEAEMGLLPVTETMLAGSNLAIAAVTLTVVALVCAAMAPAEGDSILELGEDEQAAAEVPVAPIVATPADRLDNSRVLSGGLGLLVLAFLVSWFVGRGLSLNLDIVNWTLLTAGLLLADSPRHYLALVTSASRSLGPIVLQYPLYAGIVALMTQTDLVSLFADGFVAIANEETLGFWAFVSGGVLNFFIPSGGGQWAVQGPIFLTAARELGVSSRIVVMGVAYGDQWTNLVQPFWALPLLAIAGLRARDIMGYCFLAFLAAGICLGGGLLLLGEG